MAVIAGTVTGITLLNHSKALNGEGDELTCLVTADWATYDASADTASLAAIGAAITGIDMGIPRNSIDDSSLLTSCKP